MANNTAKFNCRPLWPPERRWRHQTSAVFIVHYSKAVVDNQCKVNEMCRNWKKYHAVQITPSKKICYAILEKQQSHIYTTWQGWVGYWYELILDWNGQRRRIPDGPFGFLATTRGPSLLCKKNPNKDLLGCFQGSKWDGTCTGLLLGKSNR